MGSECIDPRFLDLDTSWRWVGSFTPRLHYPRGKSRRYPLARRLGGPQGQSARCEEEKILSSCYSVSHLSRIITIGPIVYVWVLYRDRSGSTRCWHEKHPLSTWSPPHGTSLSLVSACQTDPELTCRGIANAGQRCKPASNHVTSCNYEQKGIRYQSCKDVIASRYRREYSFGYNPAITDFKISCCGYLVFLQSRNCE
jgi:hypothetical protein